MSFPPGFIEDLKERVPVSEVVARRVRLQRRGREFVGLSPFNPEKTPSFTINDAKGFYHCFSSGRHGDVFSFLMEVEGLSFQEAVETVAGIAGVEVPRPDRHAAERAAVAEGLRGALEFAAEWFHGQLLMPEGKAAFDYLTGRGVDRATIRQFRLGFAPTRRGALAAAAEREGVAADRLIEAGLLKRGDDGSVYEYFRGRVVFPITDRRGRVVGFGGRALGDAQPKYLNSPETALFHKGRLLYGLAQAREAAHAAGRIVVVEGYMDVIALAQAGMAEVVAPLGTALTEEQIRELWKLAAEPVLCFDGDDAGLRAAAGAVDRVLPILEAGRSLRFATLPSGHDPDTLVKAEGLDAMRATIDAAEPLADLVWRRELARTVPDSPERRALLERRIGELTRVIADESVRRAYLSDLRDRFFRDVVRRGGSEPRRRRGEPPRGHDAHSLYRRTRGAADAADWHLLSQLIGPFLRFPEILPDYAERLAAVTIDQAPLAALRAALVDRAASPAHLDAEALRAHLLSVGLDAVATGVLQRDVRGRRHATSDMPDLELLRSELDRHFGELETRRMRVELERSIDDLEREQYDAFDRKVLPLIEASQERSFTRSSK